MPINEQQTRELSKKIEDVIRSTNFSRILKDYDLYLYEELIKKGFEQKNIPNDIKPEDVEGKELKLQNKLSSDSWAELLSRKEIHNEPELKRVLADSEMLARYMLDNMDANFIVTVEITESLREIRDRKPDIKTLSNAFSNAYDKHVFIKYLEENEDDIIKERVRERLTDEGVAVSIPIDKIPYKLDVRLTTNFDSIAERYLDYAIEYGKTTVYASKNIYNILKNEKAYKIDIKVDFGKLED